MKHPHLFCHGTCLRRLLPAILCGLLILGLAGCAKNAPKEETKTESEIIKAIEDFLAPQINAYQDAFNIDDLSVDVQIKELGAIGDDYVSCRIRDIILSPTLAEMLQNGMFTDEMLRQLSTIKFEYRNFEHNGYEINASSCLLYPTFRNEAGEEYTVSEDILLKGDIIAYISPNAELTHPAKVGDNINTVVYGSETPSSGTRPVGEKCLTCNGTGYVKYYYGDSDLQAILDGYDPYTVGKCTSCNGTGRK